MAIPDHPWTKASKDAAAVRIAMTVAERGLAEGELREVVREAKLDSDEPEIVLAQTEAKIHANLTGGADLSSLTPLRSNGGISSRGVQLIGAGFIVAKDQARELGFGSRDGLEKHLRPYRNGRDLLGTSRDAMVIDLFGLTEKEVRIRFPEVWQRLDLTVRKDRAAQVAKSPTNDAKAYLENWWQFGKPRPVVREALEGLRRYIATVETAKHRIFEFLDAEILPDNKLTLIASEDAANLGILQSSIHLQWTYANCGLLGVASFSAGHVYVKSKTFDPFPFPDPTPEQRAAIAELAEELDATRKLAISETDRLTMTELYNLRARLRSGVPLDDKEQRRATRARAGIVDRLHEQLDQAVADAYGWGGEWKAGTLGPLEIVARLVALNHERAAEEAVGTVRWLRPDYQVPRFGKKGSGDTR